MEEVKAADEVNDFTWIWVPFSKALHNSKELFPFEVHGGFAVSVGFRARFGA